MKNYLEMNEAEMEAEYQACLVKYREFQSRGFSLDMSRGKPGSDQLDLSLPMLDTVGNGKDMKTLDGSDVRNYGQLEGLPETRRLFGEMLGVGAENILVGGNSSLNMMFDTVALAMSLGIMGETPWGKRERIKFLCPVPGYDRHFAICELFGIEMISVPLFDDGPDMEIVRQYVENDDHIKGIWCVPLYSNPTGITYSDATVRAFAALKPAAKDFRIFWDNAYCVHHLTDTPSHLLNLFEECKKQGSEDLFYMFASTSKISFSGAGIAVMAASENNMKDLKRKRGIQTIGPNKVNQLMHARFFRDTDDIHAHMEKHRALIAPKFAAVIETLDREIAPCGIARYTHPTGGYFISFDSVKGCAKRIGALCKAVGVTLTSVGATFPYGVDPDDCNIRIAPTYPPISEVLQAMEVFCVSVRMASLEKLRDLPVD